jgi:hypothetical protein
MSDGNRRDFPPTGNGPGTSEEATAFGDAPSRTAMPSAVSPAPAPKPDGTVFSGGHAAGATRGAEAAAGPESERRDIASWAATPDFLGAVTSVLELLPEVKSAHGLALLIGLRQAHAQGRRPVTCGEAREFLGRARQISPAGSKKVVRKLVEQGLVVPVPNPCIDKAIDLHASARLARVVPTLGQPYTLYRMSRDGDLARKKFDIAWLDWRRVSPENHRMAEWILLWEGLRPGPDQVPTSLLPFFASPLSRRSSPKITAIVSVKADKAADYEFLAIDGPALQDPPFEKSARKRQLRFFTYASLAQALRADFYEAKVLAHPLFHHLTGVIRGHEHDYFRLILPISTMGGVVDCLIIVSELAKDRLDYKSDKKK